MAGTVNGQGRSRSKEGQTGAAGGKRQGSKSALGDVMP